MDTAINFPHLGIHLDNVGKTFQVFGIDIAYYGVIVVTGMMLGMFVVLRGGQTRRREYRLLLGHADHRSCGRCGRSPDLLCDICVDNYKDNLLEIFNTRHGDWRFTAVSSERQLRFYLFQSKKMSFMRMVDCIAPGLLLGQIIGRWGTSLIGKHSADIPTVCWPCSFRYLR